MDCRGRADRIDHRHHVRPGHVVLGRFAFEYFVGAIEFDLMGERPDIQRSHGGQQRDLRDELIVLMLGKGLFGES